MRKIIQVRYLLFVLLLFPLFIFRDYTPTNELKYLSIAEEAIENKSWFIFYNHDVMYSDKPPLFFWMLMIPRIITGEFHMWLMALYSLLPAIGVMAIMDRWFREQKIKHNEWTSNALLMTTAMFLGSAAIIRMDMLMTFFITLSLYIFFRMYSGKGKKRDKWLLPVWIFLALFSKGPMGVLVPVMSILVFLIIKKDIRSIGKYLGWRQWAIILGLTAVWFALAYREGGDDYIEGLLIKQTVGRGVNAIKHKEPVWYYVKNMIWMVAPWTIIYITAAWKGVKEKVYVNDIRAFFFTIILTTLVMLSVISSKIQIYMLPAFPFIVYLCSAWLSHFERTKAVKVATIITAGIIVLAFPTSFFIPKFIKYQYDSLLAIRLGMLLLSTGGVAAIYMAVEDRAVKGIRILGMSILGMFFVSAFGIKQFNKDLGLKYFAQQAQEFAEKENISNYAYYRYYTARNMDVYLGQHIYRIEDVAGLDSLNRLPYPTVLFVRDKELERNDEFSEWMEKIPESGSYYKYNWYVLGGEVVDE